jgi:hypothetical protein
MQERKMLMRAIIPDGQDFAVYSKQGNVFPLDAQRKSARRLKFSYRRYFDKSFHT